MKHLYVVDERMLELTLIAETDDGDLARLREIVGGYVERVRCAEGIVAWCDEEGGPKGRPYTIAVRALLGGRPCIVHLRGTVVLVVERASSPEDSLARVARIALPLQLFRTAGIAPEPAKPQ